MELLRLGDGTSRHGLHGVKVGVGVRDSIGILKDIGHFFEQYTVFSLDLSVPLYK